MKSKLKIIPFLAGGLIFGFSGCKTTEANYKAAYDKAMAAKETEERETIYGGASRVLDRKTMVEKGDTAEIMVKHISPVVAKGEQFPQVKRLMLVVGEFKQLFNAESMRRRFIDNGYPSAIVVQTAEPYYYIVAESYDSLKEATTALESMKNNAPLPLKAPAPFILRDPRK